VYGTRCAGLASRLQRLDPLLPWSIVFFPLAGWGLARTLRGTRRHFQLLPLWVIAASTLGTLVYWGALRLRVPFLSAVAIAILESSRINTFSFWRNQQTAGTKTTTAFDNLRATMRSIYNLCGSGVDATHPSFAVTDRPTFEGYEGLLIANERYMSKESGDAGFKNEVLQFKDIQFAYDKSTSLPAGNVYFLNTKFLKLAYQKGFWMKGRPSVAPANQTIEVFTVMCICNLFSSNPRRLGVVTAVN